MSCPSLVTLWTVAYQAPLSMGFSRQEECVAISFSRGSSQPRNWTEVSYIAGRFFTDWARRIKFCIKKNITILADTDNCLSVAICLGFYNIRFRPLNEAYSLPVGHIGNSVCNYLLLFFNWGDNPFFSGFTLLPPGWNVDKNALHFDVHLVPWYDFGNGSNRLWSNKTEEYISDTSGSLIYEIHCIQF